MKTNRNFWRVLVLALALVMMFAIVACAKDGDDTAATTEAAATAASTTAAATTTAKPKATTEPKATTTKDPNATTEPTTEAPVTGEPETFEGKAVLMPSSFDNDKDGEKDIFIFSNIMPEKFAAEGVIKVEGKDHLSTDVGVKDLVVGNFTHYYIELKNDGTDADKVLSWKVNIPEDGLYDMCIQMRMKDGKQRGTQMYVDGTLVYELDFQFKDGAEVAIQDNATDLNSYMSGMQVELTAGEHLIAMKAVPGHEKTFHFRYIYFAKSNVASVDMESSFDNNKDNAKDVFTFTNSIPDIFVVSDALVVAGKDHLSTDVGVKDLVVGNFTHYYIELKNDGTDADKTLSWEIDVAADGVYAMCIQMRMKDGKQRGTEMYVDGTLVYQLDFQFKDGAEKAVQDNGTDLNSYMSGMKVELTAGKHTIVMKAVPGHEKTFHFRYLYFVKIADLAAAPAA